jgi:hypothetical protein
LQATHAHFQLLGIILLEQILNITHRHFYAPLLPFGAIGTKLKGCITQTSLCLRHQRQG